MMVCCVGDYAIRESDAAAYALLPCLAASYGAATPADGGLYLGTPVDPLLVLLPLLEKARAEQNVFQDLEQILRCELEGTAALARTLRSGLSVGYHAEPAVASPALVCSMAASPSAHLLLPLLGSGEQLGCLCDVKSAGGQNYFRLNDERVRCAAAPAAVPASCQLPGSPWVACLPACQVPCAPAVCMPMAGQHVRPCQDAPSLFLLLLHPRWCRWWRG